VSSLALAHSIGCHWKDLWEYQGLDWINGFPQRDLEKAGLAVDIWLYGHDSRTASNSVANIEDVARALLVWIYNHEKSSAIVFVTHSLGGPIVEKGNESSIQYVYYIPSL